MVLFPMLVYLIPGFCVKGFSAALSAGAVFALFHATVGRLPKKLSLKPVFAVTVLADVGGLYFTAFCIADFRISALSCAVLLSLILNLISAFFRKASRRRVKELKNL